MKQRSKKKLSIGDILTYIVLLVYTVFVFFPILTILITSFVPSTELAVSKEFVWLPEQGFTLEGYQKIFQYDVYQMLTGIPGLLLGFLNTMWMTLIPLIVGLLISGLSAYAFSKLQFAHKETYFRFSVLISMIPLGAFSIISYVFYSNIGWTGDLGVLPLIIPGLFGGISTMFFLRTYFDGIPDALVEAASIDGLGVFGTYFKIMLPLAKPAFIAQFIFGFVAGYNNYLGPLLYLDQKPEFVTLQLYLKNINGLFPEAGSSNIYCAAAILGMIPLIILYCFAQKWFIEGVAMGSVKE